jgi:hypothetical protein
VDSIVEFVERLQNHKTLRLNGDQLLYRASAGGFNGPLLEEIVSHRAEIVAILRSREREMLMERTQVTDSRASPPAAQGALKNTRKSIRARRR